MTRLGIGMDMDKSPEDLLRSLFGDEGPAEPRPPRNGTPLFQLSRSLPEFAAETRRILVGCDERRWPTRLTICGFMTGAGAAQRTVPPSTRQRRRFPGQVGVAWAVGSRIPVTC